MKKLLIVSAVMFCTLGLSAQIRNDDVYKVRENDNDGYRKEIRIPDVGRYKVLKSDLHIHTIFSDGDVWPSFRVIEAWQEGLDVIAITDHIECRPIKDILQGDHNEAYKIAARAAKKRDILVIQGTEITRDKPFGHMNALFINDANLLDVENELDAFEAAVKQGAYIQWNHPGWPDDKSTLYPIHEKLIKEGKIHAVELVNEMEYYPLCFDWFGKYNLAPTANSDIHETIASKYIGRRPMTLILSESKTMTDVKEALFARRTIAYFNDLLIGTPELLKSLLKSCLELSYSEDGSVIVRNLSDLKFTVTYDDELVVLPGNCSYRLGRISDENLEFEFQNCYIGHNKKLKLTGRDFAE